MPAAPCRACGAAGPEPVLDLGPMALANRFVKPERRFDPEPRHPLRVARCGDCGLVQIDETVPRETLFGHYVYVTGTSEAARRHAAGLAADFTESLGLRPTDFVLEVASNDGTVLKEFQARGMWVLGVDPAANIAAAARAAGVPTRTAFFDAAVAGEVRANHGGAKLVLARHVLAHAEDLHGLIDGMRVALAADGVAAVECPHALPFLEHLEFDTVYHEHLCYFSVKVLRELFARHGLELFDVEPVDLHGGSVLAKFQLAGGPRAVEASVGRFLADEAAAGLDRAERWAEWGRRARRARDLLREEVAALRAGGQTVAAYGAAAKGMTLLGYCGFGPADVPYVVDQNPLKQGLLTPGQGIPVVPPSRLREEPPSVLLVLAWNFAAEIARQQEWYLRRGGKLLLPLPEPHYYHPGRADRAAKIRVAS